MPSHERIAELRALVANATVDGVVQSTGEFTMEARTAVPKLLDEIERLHKVIEDMTDALQKLIRARGE